MKKFNMLLVLKLYLREAEYLSFTQEQAKFSFLPISMNVNNLPGESVQNGFPIALYIN